MNSVVVTVALSLWPLWVLFAAVWVSTRIEGGKSMLGIIVLVCIGVLFFAPLLYALGKLSGAVVIALVLAAFAALTAAALN